MDRPNTSPSFLAGRRAFSLDVKGLSVALGLCADLLFYPDEDIRQDLKNLFGLVNISTEEVEGLLEGLSLEDLQAHYIALFDVNRESIQCVPYESWWQKGRLMGDVAIELKDFYRSCGFDFNEDEFKMPADHVSLQIAFICRLLDEGMVDEACFMINKHTDWIGRLYSCVEQRSKIYGKLLRITLDLINDIKEGELCRRES
ncbi:TorD/DmsD family molecular chaperone [Hippea sp. KM1]|uniref:TorD/DmsD family molecular chaperone n=1 Tax=Hippea sp. KM1 TaxID=944481 RepID=UPI00046D2F16|nr:molecular chaperone TorD family protein [Hippea sp. KM1]